MKAKQPSQDIKVLIRELGADSPAVEAFRNLRTNVQFAGVKAPTKVIAVTSTVPDEGKTTVAANLATIMALGGSQTVLVNADLRRPFLAKAFDVSGRVGLTNVLLGTTTVEEALVETGTQGLQLLPAGPVPPNPAELLSSSAMSVLLEQLRCGADMVIVDTPPLLALSDALVLAPQVDGFILVVRSGHTPRQAVLETKQRLEAVGARMLGVVLNGVKPGDGYYNYYYSHYRYHYHKGAQA